MSAFENWDIWDAVFRREVTQFYRVSLCVTCMDRLATLKECLPRNLEDNVDYPNLEFVILDYNSRKDDLRGWIMNNFQRELASGRLVYYRTDEPEFYSMTHSRNLAFKLATGAIVNSLDADNFTGKAFASYINFLANESPRNAVFSKGKRLLHGRIGFFKDEFIDILGGYDEELVGYGYDDKDILERAMALKFRLMWYGSRFVKRIDTPRNMVGQNMPNSNWRETERLNQRISQTNVANGRLMANANRQWGKGTVVKNGQETISI